VKKKEYASITGVREGQGLARIRPRLCSGKQESGGNIKRYDTQGITVLAFRANIAWIA
jgi:hypothetical protein